MVITLILIQDYTTGLYYLNSRYYDANTGRFINGDKLLGANQDILSNNIFAYCSNNPVNCFDDTGNGKRWDWFKNNVINPVKKVAKSVVKSFEIEAGIGLGFKGSVSIPYGELEFGIKGDVLNAEKNRDGIHGRTKLDGAAKVIIKPFEFGKKFEQTHDYSCPCKFIGESPYNNYTENFEPAEINPCIDIIGVETYFGFGFTLQIRFNLETFSEEMGVVELYEE